MQYLLLLPCGARPLLMLLLRLLLPVPTAAGVMVNKMSPAWFVSWLMILVFIWSTLQCYFSYTRLRKKEASKKQLLKK